MNEKEFKQRTKNVGLRVIRLVNALPKNRSCDALARQLIRSGTSIGANYRSACRAKSRPDILAKLAIVEEESDETLYWLELLIESKSISQEKLSPLMNEVNEILAMTVASMKTLRSRG